MKWFLRIVILVVIVAVLAVVAISVLINPLLKKGIEKGGTYAMGVETTLAEIDLGLLSGELDLAQLHVANPAGFRTDHFFELGSGAVAVTLPSLLSETVEVPLIELRSIALNLEEENGQKNYSVILENLKKVGESSDTEEAPPEEEKKEEEAEGKGFVIQKLTIADVNVNADWQGETVKVHIPEIPLTNIGTESEGGVVLSQLSGIIVEAILKAVVENAANRIPAEMLKELNQGLASLGKLGDYTTGEIARVTAEADEALEKAKADVDKAVDEATSKVEDAAAEGQKELDKVNEDLKKVSEDLDKDVKKLSEGLGGFLEGRKKKKKEDSKP